VELEEVVLALVTALRLGPAVGLVPGLELLAGSPALQPLLPVLEALGREAAAVSVSGAGLEVGLRCLQLQLHCRPGPIDPAEKAALKLRYAGEAAAVCDARLRVRDVFREQLGGGTHPHSGLLGARRELLRAEEVRRAGRTAERGPEADYPGLASLLRHFAATLGSPVSLLGLVAGLERGLESAVPEAQLWLRSATSFLRSVLAHSAFPDLAVPVAEATAKLIRVVSRLH
jgi:hypothetical protein